MQILLPTARFLCAMLDRAISIVENALTCRMAHRSMPS